MTDTDRKILLSNDAATAARQLLGCELIRTVDGNEVRVRIVETEAYDQTDAASHSYNGRTQRTDVMFGPAGHLYVYFTYGMHYCCNVVVGEEGYGSAVLIRAVEPISSESSMREYRNVDGVGLTNGPAKLCQALDIDKQLNGHDLAQVPLRLVMRPQLAAKDVTTAKRIGIAKAKDIPWRFYVTRSPYVSRK